MSDLGSIFDKAQQLKELVKKISTETDSKRETQALALALEQTKALALAQALARAVSLEQTLAQALTLARELERALKQTREQTRAQDLLLAEVMEPVIASALEQVRFLKDALEQSLTDEETSENPDALEISIEVPEDIEPEELEELVRQMAIKADAVHRSHGGNGLKIDTIDSYQNSRVPEGVGK